MENSDLIKLVIETNSKVSELHGYITSRVKAEDDWRMEHVKNDLLWKTDVLKTVEKCNKAIVGNGKLGILNHLKILTYGFILILMVSLSNYPTAKAALEEFVKIFK